MAKTKNSTEFKIFIIFVGVLFTLGMIIGCTGIGLYERDLDDCYYNEQDSLGTIISSNRYNTRCSYCMRLKIKYHTLESGEITTYMIARTYWAAGFNDLENASAPGKKMVVFYKSDKPGSPYQYPEKCRPDAGWLIMIILGFIILFMTYMITCINVRDVPPKNTKTITSGVIQRFDPIPQAVYKSPYPSSAKDDTNYAEEYLTGDDYTQSSI